MSKNSRFRFSPPAKTRYRWHLIPAILQSRKLALIQKLGGKCVSCDEDDPAVLEFHHKYGKSWRSRDYSRFQRMAKYEEDADAGEIELLCDACHNNTNDHPDDCFCAACRGEEF